MADHPIDTLLPAMGDTPAAIAQTLQAQHVRGVPGCPCRCALAVYLRAYGFSVTVLREVVLGYRRWPLSEALAAFVRAFDSGAYPALVQP